MDKSKIIERLEGFNIKVGNFHSHSKASECYVEVTFVQEDGFSWDTIVPYVNRRAGLFIESEEDLVAYLKSLKPYFQKASMQKWKVKERKEWEESKAEVTKEFFFALLTFRPVTKFPPNNNPARRIQDIKDAGYTIATIHHYEGKKSARILLPIPKTTEMGYETFTPQFKSRVIHLLNGINAYESKPTTPKGLIPDHKFSEVRWDKNTKEKNPMEMSDEEVIQKFQLLDNQRNLQKREICRNCFQTGKRGIIYGIPFFYQGREYWDENIPTLGKIAEQGCIGCAWYDIERWRSELIKYLNGK